LTNIVVADILEPSTTFFIEWFPGESGRHKKTVFYETPLLNTTQDGRLAAIETVNTTQDTRITDVETKTNKLPPNGSILDVNNTCTQLKLNQDLNMNNNNITNTKNITYTGYNGLMNSYVSSSSMFNFDSVLLGDNTNGSGFNFKCIKSPLTKNLSIDYNNVNLNNRTLTNCSTIDTITSNISGHNTQISELFSRKAGFAKCRIVRDTSTYTLAWSFGFVPISTPPYNIYIVSVSTGVVQ
jgi:hypothetical protein